ncbi:MAG: glycosyltransferase family 39 protein [Chloroflexi bacterium]|nr:glycosyltransferase family 39 protein [Chloroflexota bacterium]
MHQPISRLRAVTMRLASWNWLLIGAVALGAALRLWGIPFGLPYLYHPDEGLPVTIALRVLQTGDFNPHFFHWSSLLFYLNAFVYYGFFIFGRITGRFTEIGDLAYPDVEAIAVGRAIVPEEFLLGRALTAIFGALTLIAIYAVCRKTGAPRWASGLAALLLAVETISVRNSQFIRPDIFFIFFALVAIYFSLAILDDARPRNYLLAGIAAGLAASFKYNAAVVCLAILAAHLLRLGWRGLFRREIYFAGALSIATFIATTPYALLDLSTFIRIGPLQAAEIYATGHAGAEGNTFYWYLNFFWGAFGVTAFLALFEVAAILWRRDARGIVVLVFPAAYFFLINLYTVHFEETALPLIPFLSIFAAQFLARLAEGLTRRVTPRLLRWSIAAGICGLVLPMLIATVNHDIQILQPESREFARAWIEKNVPAGARVAVESYAPYVERPRFMVEGFEGMIEHPPKWYEQNGFEYLVFSYGSYGRFYENAAQYPDQLQRYDDFFKRYPTVARFDQNGYEVRVLKIETPELPSTRVAARFGLYSGWAELVGYDLRAPNWISGETQRIGFHWRALGARREPLMLTARLIDRDGRAIAESRGPLFGDAYVTGAWPEGIARSGLDFPVPGNARTGLYRMQLEVDGGGIGRVSVLSYANQPIADKLFIGPFKIAGPPPAREELAKARMVDASFAKLITLVGYAMKPEPTRPGDPLTLTLYWRADFKMQDDYTVFIHLLDNNGAVRAQIDAQPRGGNYPTSIWDAGEVVRDDYVLNLPNDLAPGDYRISLGLYQFPSLARLGMLDASGRLLDDHLILDDVVRVR